MVVIGNEFVEPPRRIVDSSTPVHCIENWAPLADLPAQPKANPLSCRLGLDGRFVFLYSGTLGLKHDPERLLQLGARIRSWPDAGAGGVLGRSRHSGTSRRKTHDRGLTTTRVIDYQPYERLPELLGAADVLTAVLGRNAALALGAVEGVDVPHRGPADPRRDRGGELGPRGSSRTRAQDSSSNPTTPSAGWMPPNVSTTTTRCAPASVRTHAPQPTLASTSIRSPNSSDQCSRLRTRREAAHR